MINNYAILSSIGSITLSTWVSSSIDMVSIPLTFMN